MTAVDPSIQISSHELPGIRRLIEVVDVLRSDNGCPWDREQTLATLKPYLIEECYELIDAIDEGSIDKHIEELGDVLLQVVLQSRIRREQEAFSFDDVAQRIADKLVRRHPHVFADVTVSGTGDVLKNWESIKAQEKSKPKSISLFDGIPHQLPALQRAQRVQSRAANVGFDWSRPEQVLDKIEEEIAEIREALASGVTERVAEEIGDLFFALCNFCRFLDIQAEEATQAASRKFVRRFQAMVERLERCGKPIDHCSLDEMEGAWNEVKREAKP